MKNTGYKVHSEYVFNLDELKNLLSQAGPDDDVFYVTIGFDCSGSSNRVYQAKIEGSIGVRENKNLGNVIEGCPKPPDCPTTLNSIL